MFEYVVLSWWNCFGMPWKLQEMGPGWKKQVTGAGQGLILEDIAGATTAGLVSDSGTTEMGSRGESQPCTLAVTAQTCSCYTPLLPCWPALLDCEPNKCFLFILLLTEYLITTIRKISNFGFH